MAYTTESGVKDFCGDQTLDSLKVATAISHAKGFIDTYCGATFEDPREDGEDRVYYFDGDGSHYLFPVIDGPFQEVTSIEYEEDFDTWETYTSGVKNFSDYLQLEDQLIPRGDDNWRVTGSCYVVLTADQQELLERAANGICKLLLVPLDEPVGRSVVSLGADGLSFSYREIDSKHPTGHEETDSLLRMLVWRRVKL
jgi:hypothetical protein